MAGGVANIWGYLSPSADEGGSQPYPNRQQLQTWSRFFEHRFVRGMRRANDLTDGFALSSKNVMVFYKEDTSSLRFDLSGRKTGFRAVAVDTKKPYDEIGIGSLKPEAQTWNAPYRSDWAVAVENE
jgi:hypothetical protein